MDRPHDSSLISAYLDNELDASQRADVEQLLATSAEARQLLDELRALRAGLQELPQHQLEIDFAQSVLRRAEHEMQSTAQQSEASVDLSPASSTPHSPSPITLSETPSPALASRRRVPFGPRGIAWSLVAIAAAVLIMVATRQPEQNQQVAMRRNEPATARTPELREQDRLAADADIPNADKSKSMQPPIVAGTSTSSLQSAVPVPGLAAGNVDRKVTPDLDGRLSNAIDGVAADNKADASNTQSPVPAAAALGVNRPAASDLASDARQKDAGVSAGEKIVPEFNDRRSESVSGLAPRPDDALKQKLATDSAAASNDAVTFGPQAPSSLVLVQVNMSAEAAERHAFDRLLAKNNIAMDLPADQYDVSNEALIDRGNQQLADKTVEGIRRDEKKSDPSENGQRHAPVTGESLAGKNAETPAAQSDLDMVYVEASPKQIADTLADIRKQNEWFSSVVITNTQSDFQKEPVSEPQSTSRALTASTKSVSRSAGEIARDQEADDTAKEKGSADAADALRAGKQDDVGKIVNYKNNDKDVIGKAEAGVAQNGSFQFGAAVNSPPVTAPGASSATANSGLVKNADGSSIDASGAVTNAPAQANSLQYQSSLSHADQQQSQLLGRAQRLSPAAALAKKLPGTEESRSSTFGYEGKVGGGVGGQFFGGAGGGGAPRSEFEGNKAGGAGGVGGSGAIGSRAGGFAGRANSTTSIAKPQPDEVRPLDQSTPTGSANLGASSAASAPATFTVKEFSTAANATTPAAIPADQSIQAGKQTTNTRSERVLFVLRIVDSSPRPNSANSSAAAPAMQPAPAEATPGQSAHPAAKPSEK